MNREWRNRIDRGDARDKRLAVVHNLGHVGYVHYNQSYKAEVKFPDWNGKCVIKSYGEFSTFVKITDTPYDEYIQQQQGKSTMNALYEVTMEDGSKKFATKMAEKSKTSWVMEIKGTQEYKAFDVANIIEVVPYTIRVRLMADGKTSDREVEEGKYALHNLLLLSSGELATVVALDTKFKGAPEMKVVGKVSVLPV